MDMKRFLQNAGRLLTSPKMTLQYAQWNWDRLCHQPHERKLPGKLRVRGFRNFSEYWTFSPPDSCEFRLLQRIAASAKVIVDIGANLGSFTLTLARLAPQARIFSFEPAPTTYRILDENIRLNALGNISLQMQAVCEKVGTVQFTDAALSPGNNSIFRAAEHSNCPTVDVPATTLDQFCRGQSIEAIDFLKIDAEGAEPLVVRGAADLFRRRAIKAGIIEVAAYWLRAGGSDQVQLARQVRELGYDLFFLSPDGQAGNRMTDEVLMATNHVNALFLPN